MATLKCKMCGGDLVIEPDSTVCECEYCGSKQTIPVVDDEKKIKLYERANKLRYNCDFDKAAGVYENIIADFPDEAEAYWGLLLCKFGIEYVDSPDNRKVPTCHRSSFDSIMDDPDFEMVMENSDSAARAVYRAEAKQIEEIRKGIIEVSGKEPPYDIFICYKETAEDGQRTLDSVLAQDIYDALTAKGYRVFFSRVTLEDKLGTEYEPYIFAALNSAKLMLAFGTSYDYYNAVWVKNEWSRYLKLMAQDKSKHLIPCYKDIDAYDMPKEFAKLQAQDLGKVGATQDLLRGIEKILGGKPEKAAPVVQQVVTGGPNVESLLDRAYMAIEDKDWDGARSYFDRVLDMDSRCGEAYLGLFILESKLEGRNAAQKAFLTATISPNYTNDKNWQRAKRFADSKLAEELSEWENNREVCLKREAEEVEKRKAEAAERARREAEAARKAAEEKEAREKKKAEEKARIESEKRAKQKAEIEAQRKRARKIRECRSEAEQIAVKTMTGQYLQKAQTEYVNAQKLYVDAESELAAMPEQAEINSIEQSIEEKEKRIQKLGVFKGKEKKQLAEQITQLHSRLLQIREVIEVQKQKVEQLKSAAEKAAGGVRKIEAAMAEKLVLFGHLSDGTVIPWRVLGMQDNLVLVISKYAVKNYPFDKESSRWDTSEIRAWLHNDFLLNCFSMEEQKNIKMAETPAGLNPQASNVNPGNDVRDKIFLLSITEAEEFFDSPENRRCMFLDGGFCSWWLRSPGRNNLLAAFVNGGGSLYGYGIAVDDESLCVRPALWLNFED